MFIKRPPSSLQSWLEPPLVEERGQQNQVNNADSAIIFLINHWSVRLVRMVKLVQDVQIVQVVQVVQVV